MRKCHTWTDEDINYLKEIAYGKHMNEIIELMSKKCNKDFTYSQIKGIMGRHKIKTGFTGRFEKGQKSWNKGTKGICKANKTSFKKGDIPYNKKPIGSERVNIYGYIEIKIAEPNIWEYKQRVIYEKYYGKVPEGYAVLFADKDKTNFDINNLVLVSKEELRLLNYNKLIYNNSDLTKAGVNIVKVIEKISSIKKVYN